MTISFSEPLASARTRSALLDRARSRSRLTVLYQLVAQLKKIYIYIKENNKQYIIRIVFKKSTYGRAARTRIVNAVALVSCHVKILLVN